jgi:dimethylamine monooxygenase subunit A
MDAPAGIPPEIFSGAPHRLTMGLRPLDLDTWLDADPDHPQMRVRRELLSERRGEVFAALPDSLAACEQVATRVAAVTSQRLPGVDHPLVEAALQVRDDLCVLEQRDGSWVLTGAVVCFPSRWLLREKLGKDVLSIHDPVPRYRDELGRPTEASFAAIVKQAPRWRMNWTVLDDPVLFQPTAPIGPRYVPGRDGYLRVERQCLVPVGESIVFSIRTTVVPVADLDEHQVTALLASITQTPEDLAAYRGWSRAPQ